MERMACEIRKALAMSSENGSAQSSIQRWGGPWTEDKLEILRRYLDAYTTALKYKNFALWYVDAFAGTGEISVSHFDADQSNSMLCGIEIENERASLDGSARIAADIQDKPFDKLIFIEKDAARVEWLQRRFGSDSRVDIRNNEANQELQRICQTMPGNCRAVVFLDPFGTQVEWKTIKSIAQTQRIDAWILFPTMAVRRLLPRKGLPAPRYEPRLKRIFGNSIWKERFYREKQQPALFGEGMASHQSSQGTQAIVEYYRERMQKIFAGVSDRRSLRHPRNNSVLFDLVFAVSNPNPQARQTAMRIAEYILDNV